MEIKDIPTWVPEPVRRAAAVYGAGHPLMERLLSDPVMERVWKYFQGHPVRENFQMRFKHGTGLPNPDLQGLELHWHDTPVSDQVLVFVFYAALIAANNTRETPDEKLIDAEVDKLRETKRLVSSLRTWAPWPMLEVEPHIDRAITDLVTLCNERIALLDYGGKPSVVEIKGPESIIKSAMRSIGAATHAIYGECCYGQLVTMAHVMFAPPQSISISKMEKWCTRPPLPTMDAKNGRGPTK